MEEQVCASAAAIERYRKQHQELPPGTMLRARPLRPGDDEMSREEAREAVDAMRRRHGLT